MSIPISCPNCGEHYGVSDELAGKQVRCRECGKPVSVEGGAAKIRRPKSRWHFYFVAGVIAVVSLVGGPDAWAGLLVAGAIVILALFWPRQGPQRKCPDCAEWVKAQARVCKHCGAKLRIAADDN